MKRLKVILKLIGDALLLAVAFAIFQILVSALAIGATLIVAVIGSWIGLGQDIFIYATLIVAYWKAWDFFAWIVGKIADWEKRRKEREYFERLNNT